MITLYLIRHGTTKWNKLWKIQGKSDTPLDEQGEELAKKTGEALAAEGIRFDRVWSSPLQRAYRTAQLAAPGCKVLTDERLSELSFGAFEGRIVQDMLADASCAFRYFKADPYRYNQETIALSQRFPEDHYETLDELRLRTADFMKSVIEPLALSGSREAEAADLHILISGHGALNRALMMYMQKNEDLHSFWGKGLQSNCGINLIELDVSPDGSISYRTDDICRVFYTTQDGPLPSLL